MTTSPSLKLKFNQQQNNEQQPLPTILPQLMISLARNAMREEIYLTPKPGLVDANNNGSHNDMTLDTFILSINAISPYIGQFLLASWNAPNCPASELLSLLRPIGINAEKAMFKATNGVNTHKGMIFILGLISGAVGWLRARNMHVDANGISEVIQTACQHLVEEELTQQSNEVSNSATAGEKTYQKYGLSGARGEAESGLSSIIHYALPAYKKSLKNGATTQQAMHHTLLTLLANNNDSNLVSRGGLEGLSFVKARASELLKQKEDRFFCFEKSLVDFDNQLMAKNLSPGGSADLLAATWLINEIEQLFNS